MVKDGMEKEKKYYDNGELKIEDKYLNGERKQIVYILKF